MSYVLPSVHISVQTGIKKGYFGNNLQSNVEIVL
ncbi:hypothetical protein WN51_06180 [Melipona quadrifasciata]|uniref:Uncharacterized protein n=1 Tax=Melipona quadrifasciata TaxID=166423 RepID=A0A0N0BCS5_9HYME|nr:hypothetical protein WN51_06180 [Melipona quadrifasciata]